MIKIILCVVLSGFLIALSGCGCARDSERRIEVTIHETSQIDGPSMSGDIPPADAGRDGLSPSYDKENGLETAADDNTISVSFTDMPLSSLLRLLQIQSGVHVRYPESLADTSLTITVRERSITEVLEIIAHQTNTVLKGPEGDGNLYDLKLRDE